MVLKWVNPECVVRKTDRKLSRLKLVNPVKNVDRKLSHKQVDPVKIDS
jgi:hypothetical protein